MSQTIYASFNDVELADKAAGALLDHGILNDDLSIIASPSYRESVAREAGTTVRAGGVAYVVPPAAQSVGAVPPYPVGYVPEGFGGEVASGTPVVVNDYDRDTKVTWPHGSTVRQAGIDDPDPAKAESTAKAGITTTTPEDASVGAIKGTGVGLGVGILAGLATLVVPGVGLVFGGGALAAAALAAASTTVAGAAVGGVIGYLKDQGVDEVAAASYQNTVNSGGAVIALNVPSNGIGLQEVESLLNKYGASSISAY